MTYGEFITAFNTKSHSKLCEIVETHRGLFENVNFHLQPFMELYFTLPGPQLWARQAVFEMAQGKGNLETDKSCSFPVCFL